MKYFIILMLFSLQVLLPQAAISQTLQVNSANGAKTWETQADGVTFSLTQILPNQVRAFYGNRGFTLEQIEPYATSCVYMTVLRNDHAPGNIHFISNDWMVKVDNKRHKLISVSQWVKRLSTPETKKSPLIAFRWAQFPPEQEYKPGGDWNQGMLSMGLPADSLFNITATWDIEGKKYKTTLNEVQCAK